MPVDFDAIVVGAGPAGTAAAYDLHCAGHRVLLVDRRSFPRMKPCGGGITIKTLKRLRWAVTPVLETATRRLRMGVSGVARPRQAVFEAGSDVCTFAVRAAFDAYNLDRVVEAGVQFQRVDGISSIAVDGHGVRAAFGDRTVSAKYLVGADGANSTVRRLTGPAPWFRRGFAIEGLVPNAAIGEPPIAQFLFGQVRHGYGWLFPKRDHVNAGIYTWDDAVTLGKDQLTAYVRDRLGVDAVDHMVGFPIGFGAHTAPRGSERIVLVGDAGGFAEPLLGEGIHNAVKSGQAAAAAIDAVESGRAVRLPDAYRHATAPIRSDLATYERAKRLFYAGSGAAGFRALGARPVRTAMMRGFAAGLTLDEIVRPFPFSLLYVASPFFHAGPPASILATPPTAPTARRARPE